MTTDLLRSGSSLPLPEIGDVRVGTVTQRNWSRVATATSTDGRRFFLKQFVDRLGVPHRKGYDGELLTRAGLGPDRLAGAELVPVAAEVPDRLLLAHPYVELRTIDSITLARRADAEVLSAIGHALRDILERSRCAADHHPADRSADETVEVWKGLDPKNVGWDVDGRLWLFDFGPPTTAPMHVAAARAISAGLLCRWMARPRPYVLWPERLILRNLCTPLVPLTDLASVERSLDQSFALRAREPQRAGLLGTATRLGLGTVGRAHWWSAHREAQRLFSS